MLRGESRGETLRCVQVRANHVHASVRVDARSEAGEATQLEVEHDHVQKEETLENCAQKEGEGGDRQDDEHLRVNTSNSPHLAYHILRHLDALHFPVNLTVKKNARTHLIAISHERKETEHA